MNSICQNNCKCEACRTRISNKKYYDKNKDKINAARREKRRSALTKEQRKPLTEEQRKKYNQRRNERRRVFGRPKEKGVPYHIRYSAKNAARAKKWREDNKDRVKQKRKERTERLKISDPGYIVLQRIRVCGLQRFSKKRHLKAVEYTGSTSHEEFISKMNDKTNEKNWVLMGYQLDHIVQQNWIKEFAAMNKDNPDVVGFLINNHSNLRPLPAEENNYRSKWDVTVFDNLASYEKWKPFLNEKIKNAYNFYSANRHLFCGKQINRGSSEEKVILSYIAFLAEKH